MLLKVLLIQNSPPIFGVLNCLGFVSEVGTNPLDVLGCPYSKSGICISFHLSGIEYWKGGGGVTVGRDLEWSGVGCLGVGQLVLSRGDMVKWWGGRGGETEKNTRNQTNELSKEGRCNKFLHAIKRNILPDQSGRFKHSSFKRNYHVLPVGDLR